MGSLKCVLRFRARRDQCRQHDGSIGPSVVRATSSGSGSDGEDTARVPMGARGLTATAKAGDQSTPLDLMTSPRIKPHDTA
jgi:hypothetical protein